MRQPNWDDLRLFLALIRSGNVRDAADASGVSHATVARRIDGLVHQTGATLFHRHKGQYELTPTGRDLMALAEEFEEHLLELGRKGFGKSRELAGPVVLTMTEGLVISPLMGALREFAERYSEVQLHIDVSTRPVSLDRGEADLALRFGAQPPPHLVGKKVTSVSRAVYAAKDADAENLPWVGFTSPGFREDWKVASPYPERKSVLFTESLNGQLAACKAGLGIATLPCFLGDPEKGLQRLTEPAAPKFHDLWLLKHADARNNRRVRVLSTYLEEQIEKLWPVFLGETGRGPAN